jgi:hypothetical protein
MAPVQRDGVEYEFTLVMDMDLEHRGVVNKSRCAAVADAVVMKPGAELAATLRAWLESGEAAKPPAEAGGNGKHSDDPATPEQLARLREYSELALLAESDRVHIQHALSGPITKGRAGAFIGRIKQKLAELEEKGV